MNAGRSALIVVAALAACAAPQGDLHVPIPPHIASVAPTALANAPPRNVALPPFVDAAAHAGQIGARGAAGAVIIDPPPAQLLRDAFAAELRRAGHTIANGAGADTAGVTINGNVIGFTLRMTSTAVDWQVIVEANVAVSAHSDDRTVNHAYATRCQDHSYTAPGASVIAGVVAHCVDDLARQFSSDIDIAEVLGAP